MINATSDECGRVASAETNKALRLPSTPQQGRHASSATVLNPTLDLHMLGVGNWELVVPPVLALGIGD